MIRDGLLVVISSPSGGGKTTICDRLREQNPSYRYSVSVTTRPKRADEVNGRHYHFTTEDDFRQRMHHEEFAEWAQVHDHYYGTSRAFIDQILENRQVALFDLDVQGGLQIKQAYPQCVLVFIMPPSPEELEERLRGRQTDQEEVIRARLENAKIEMTYWSKYDYAVVNDQLDRAVERVQAIIDAELCNVSRIKASE